MLACPQRSRDLGQHCLDLPLVSSSAVEDLCCNDRRTFLVILRNNGAQEATEARPLKLASHGVEAVEQWRLLRPDVTLLDLQMPRLDGVGVIEEVRAQDPEARFVVLTTFDTDEAVYRAIRAGAKGYLMKDAPREALLDCIRRVHQGETSIAPSVAAKLADRVSGEALTGREQEVLQLLTYGKSNKEIAAGLGISETTVKSHLKSVYGKLNVLSRTEAVNVASRRGLVRM